MADLKIPKLNMNSNKYIFKKKLSLRRKSRRKLFLESALMFILSVFLIYVNYLIPNKNLVFQNLPATLDKSFLLIIDLFSNLYEVFLVIFVIVSYLISVILLIGSIYRIFKISRRKTKMMSYK